MSNIEMLDYTTINTKTEDVLNQLLNENKKLKEIILNANSAEEVNLKLKNWVYSFYREGSNTILFSEARKIDKDAFNKLTWQEVAALRILDYINYAGNEYGDPNLTGENAVTNPFETLWLAAKYGLGGANVDFMIDMLYLFRQFKGETEAFIPTRSIVENWMDKYHSGLDPQIVEIQKRNKQRIIDILIKKIDEGKLKSKKYNFEPDMNFQQKREMMAQWWKDRVFHLKFAVREPELLNELLNFSLDEKTMKILKEARECGIPLFVNPYYLSLLIIDGFEYNSKPDQAIRDYIFHSKALIEEFGKIKAWEKEDMVKKDEPNAAGWFLPNDVNVHRRYPEVAILIPETVGRACAGLCVSCQRMYDFQRGHLNFNLKKLRPKVEWKTTLSDLLDYFEKDTQLRDILITGGDAFMSSDNSLRVILDEVYHMACRKKEHNKTLPEGEKLAEILRIRLGTRILAYLPQRITPELSAILKSFRKKAEKIGIKQFIVQTHFESALEITPSAKIAIERITRAGWIITNQTVFTASASRRGHTLKLRKVLNDVGVLPYYTFSVKGFKENSHNFATNARLVQELWEEKSAGTIPKEYDETIRDLHLDTENIVDRINEIRNKEKILFLGTDRNVLNLPGVGKSLTFRVIGITRLGRRILEFDHDNTRNHSPVIEKMGKIVIVESKSINEYLNQLKDMGEDIKEYESIWGYSIGQTEERQPVWEYPKYDFEITNEYSNLLVE
ncbi:MAG: KamA family protein [Chlorobi bacterium]|nr:KamA family protein [Chlorobiota bacterium]